MSPVRQAVKRKQVQPAASSSAASDLPAWFVNYQQENDTKFSEQKQINEQQGKAIKQQSEEIKQQSEEIKQQSEQIKSLTITVQAYEGL